MKHEILLATFALVAAGEAGLPPHVRCARRMDTAAELVANAPAALLERMGIADPAAARLRVIANLARACALCAACPRGQSGDLRPREAVTRPPPPAENPPT